jgi:osmotically-inducible protein OsmY
VAQSNKIPDKTILQNITQKLLQPGTGSQNSIKAAIRNGDLTLSGTIQYEHHRRHIVRTATSIAGVRRVIDQLKVGATKPKWS